jgi:hypothetical protein
MGRLPATWANRIIQSRWPYTISGEFLIESAETGQQFPDATFQNGQDKPFEIHRMIPRVYALDSEGVLLPTQPDQELLLGLVRAKIVDLGREQLMTKNPTLLGLLCKGSSERTWEFAEPMYLIRAEQIQITLDALTFPVISNLDQLKVAIDFQGFVCVVAPPSENR